MAKMTCINTVPLEGNDIAPPLVKGAVYTIKSVHVCQCGQEHFDVGLQLLHNFVRCYNCKKELPDTTHWAHPSRFA